MMFVKDSPHTKRIPVMYCKAKESDPTLGNEGISLNLAHGIRFI